MPPSSQGTSLRYWLLPSSEREGAQLLAAESDMPSGEDAARSKTRIAVVNFFKGLFGAGVLALPNAFESTGVPLGVIMFLFVAMICLTTMLLLLDCQRIVREKRGMEVESYEELAGVIFGPMGRRVVQVLMALLTLVFCTGFVYAISMNLSHVFPALSRRVFCLIVFPALMGLSWISYLKDLWVTSIVGLFVYVIGVVGVTVYYSASNFQSHPDTMELRWGGLAHFFGTALYTLEGINLTLPVAASMKSRRRPPLVMAIGLLGFTVVSLFYSAYAYSAGLGGCDIITSCLKPGALTDTVRVALSISLIATHPVYLIVASNILESVILGDAEEDRGEGAQVQEQGARKGQAWSYAFKARIIRSLEVALTCLLAAVVPDFGLFTALVGSTALTFIGFIMPSCMWVAVLERDAGVWVKVRNYSLASLIVLVGLVAMGVGGQESIRQLAHRQ